MASLIYDRDLAYIHDAGFSGYALKAAPGLLGLLRRSGVESGLVVDLGCGSGRWARELNRAGYEVVGVDQSAAMIRLARRIAPESRFRTASLLQVELPACDAITAIGECLNYTRAGPRELARFFARVLRALRPGGAFVFDVAEPARAPSAARRQWLEGEDWAVLVEAAGSPGRTLLTRRITCFRRVGKLYRRTGEVHSLRLYRRAEVAEALDRAGFRARVLSAYGRFHLPEGIVGFLARRQ